MSRFPAKITKAIAPGTVFVPMHWGALWGEHSEANILSHSEACPISLEPELKACAVRLVPTALEMPNYSYQGQNLGKSQIAEVEAETANV